MPVFSVVPVAARLTWPLFCFREADAFWISIVSTRMRVLLWFLACNAPSLWRVYSELYSRELLRESSASTCSLILRASGR